MIHSSKAMANGTVWQRFLAYLLHRRVRITAILFVVLVAEDVLERVHPHSLLNLRDYRVVLGLSLVLGGVAFRSWAAGTLIKRKQLATSGPYQLVRHPLYVGSFLMMLGFCCLVDDPENVWIVLGPILLLYVLRAISEEQHLAQIFPDEWPAFVRAVPRFIPRRIPTALFRDWSFRQWIHNREYQALCAALLGLAAIQVWHVTL